MISINFSGELADLAKSVGLLTSSGAFDTTWFNDPFGRLQSVLSNADQRAALLRLLDSALPPAMGAGIPADEKWHPLLEKNDYGNAYLTVREESDGIAIGVAGNFGTGALPPPVQQLARLEAQIPIIRIAGNAITPLPGTQDGPLVIRLRIGVDIQRAAGAAGIALSAIALEVRVLPTSFSLMVVLQGLSLDPTQAPADKVIDPAELGSEAPELIAGLLKHIVAQNPAAAGAVADFAGLLGLGDAAVPAFPFAQLTSDASALQRWLSSMFDGGGAAIQAWLRHFGGLFRSILPAAPVAQREPDPDTFSVRLIEVGPAALQLVVARRGAAFRLGLALNASVLVEGKRASIGGGVAIVDVPLSGASRARVLPDAYVRLQLSGDAGAELVPLAAAFKVGALRAGLGWDGAQLQPQLELVDVQFSGTSYPQLDLTHTDSVVAAARDAVIQAIGAALGNGTMALRIASLAGLAPPRNPANPAQALPGWPHALDVARFVSDPLGAIAAFHRGVLTHPQFGWDRLFNEIVALLPGLSASVVGAGTPTNPWRIALGPPVGPMQLEVAAWNAQTSGNAADVQQLRVGLRLGVAVSQFDFGWLAELLAFDLPAAGSGHVSVVGAQHIRLGLSPAFSGSLLGDFGGVDLSGRVGAAAVSLNWTPGSSVTWNVSLTNVRIRAGAEQIDVPAIVFPPAAGFDLANPVAAAATLGLTPATLERLISLLVTQVTGALGPLPAQLTSMLGMHRQTLGLPADWPTWSDPANPGLLLTDPIRAMRSWLQRLLTTASADGIPHVQRWVESLLILTDLDDAELLRRVSGAGTYDEPWTLPLLLSGSATASAALQLHVWLDPQGPPPALVAGVAALAAAAASFDELLAALRSVGNLSGPLRSRLHGRSAAGLNTGFALLDDLLARSDGLVPLASQQPELPTWTSAPPVTASHWSLPGRAEVIDLVCAQVDALAGGAAAARTVLLLSPQYARSLAGGNPWATLLASPNAHGAKDAAARFDLADSSIPDPLTYPLDTVTAAADWYVGEVPDDDLSDWPTQAQIIGRMVDRMRQLRPGTDVTLVAHGTVGVAARHYAAGAAGLRGLITLGTPHLGADLPILVDDDLVDAVRVGALLAPNLPAGGTVRTALEHLSLAIDGYVPASPGDLPKRFPFPFTAFDASGAELDVGILPVYTIGATVAAGGSLPDIRGAAQGFATAAAAVARAAPTHVCAGVSFPLELPPAQTDGITAEARIRLDLLQISLGAAGAPPPRPAYGLRFSARLYQPGRWILGEPSTLPLTTALTDPRQAFDDIRLRELELGLDASLTAGRTPTARPWIRLRDCAFRGVTLPYVDATDPSAAGLVGALFQSLSAGDTAVGGPAGKLLDAFTAIGLAGPDPHGGVGFVQDAWTALETDALTFLSARLPGALAATDGWLGLKRVGSSDGWSFSPGGGLQLSVERTGTNGPWTARLQTPTATGTDATLDLGLSIDARVALNTLNAELDVSATLGVLALTWHASSSGQPQLSLSAPPWLPAVTLVPAPPAADLRATLSNLWPRALFSGALSVALRSVAPGLRVAAVERFLADTAAQIRSVIAGDASGLSLARVRDLINAIASAAGLPPDDGLTLPGNLRLTVEEEPAVSGSGTPGPSAMRIVLATTSDVGGALAVRAGVRIDTAMHATPLAQITLSHDIDGTWGRVGIRFGADASGISLSVLPGANSAIDLLPNFSGFGALRGAAAALLPAALDQLVATFAPRPNWMQRALDVALALDLYDAAGGFAAKSAQLRALIDGNVQAVFGPTQRDQIAQRVVDLVGGLPGLPVNVTRDGSRARVGFQLPAGVTGQLGVIVGFSGNIPNVGLFVDGLEIAGVLVAQLAFTAGPGGVECAGRFGVRMDAVQIPLAPRVDFSAATGAGGGVDLMLRPLAADVTDTGSGPLTLQIAPTFAATFAAGSVEALLTQWLLPLVSNVLLKFAASEGLLAKKLWPTGPTVQDVLVGAQLVTAAAPTTLRTPLPDVWPLIAGALEIIANGVEVPIADLKLGLISRPSPPAAPRRIGIRLRGQQTFEINGISIAILLGAPQTWTQTVGGDAGTAEVSDGFELLLLTLGTATPDIDVSVNLSGVGVGVYGVDGKPLLDDPNVRIGGVGGYFFGSIDTKPSLLVSRLGGGLQIKQFGLPLGALTGGGGGGGNPVVTAMMSQGGASSGDSQAPTPGVDLELWYREDDRLHIRMTGDGGSDGILWIGVHSQFGPIYIDQVGIRLTSEEAGLVVDGGLSIAGLSAQVDELSLTVPYKNPSALSLDLKGLGLGFSQGGITIAGALAKFSPPIEYDGMLVIKINTIGAVAVGCYAVPEDAGEKYTSLAILGGVFVPIGYSPIITFTGFMLGVGVNRRLIVPTDMNQIPDFMLVQALDDPEGLANDPLGALLRFRAAVPPHRGAFWLAAGARGTVFQIVNITAVLYVALDGGLEIGILGVARAALPPGDTALVTIELALKARFSTAEMLLSIQAQLTDNSWLFSEDCQLTGGFGFFMWFRESQMLLTLGGYHPAFQRRPEYPNIPRLGFRWNLFDVIQIKGENYFALTNTCVMAGARLEVTYGPDWVQLWFTAHADFLASWDPVHFTADVGIAVGARLEIEVCFIACAHVSVSVSVGAELHLEGPPLHGTVTVDLGVTTVTVPFGDNVPPVPDPLTWDAFVLKYLLVGDSAALPVDVQVSSGLLKPDPPGGTVAPGTESQPWKMAAEWRFQTETRMPVRRVAFVETAAVGAWQLNPPSPFGGFTLLNQTYEMNIAPMRAEDIEATHRVLLETFSAGAWRRLTAAELRPKRFILDPRLGQVSEATYRLFDGPPPAAANTLPAVLGLNISGICELRSNAPDVIPIAKLRDATNPRPLPFPPDETGWVEVQIAGRAAARFADLARNETCIATLAASVALLSGADSAFASGRRASGLRPGGIGPLATRALLTRRSSAPLMAPLSTGLSMTPVRQKLFATVAPPKIARPVGLAAPRLRAVMQARIAPTAQTQPNARLTVNAAQAKRTFARVDVTRGLVRRVAVAGADLRVVPRVDAPRATRFANTARTTSSPQVGGVSTRKRARAFASTERLVGTDGAELRAGVTQVWDVPPFLRALRLQGDQAVRVTLLSRGGSVLNDLELGDARDVRLELPGACTTVVVTGLGKLPGKVEGWSIAPTTGAVTAFTAPAGRQPATGWQSSDQAIQASGSTLLVRGGVVRLSAPTSVSRTKQALPHGVMPMSAAVETAAALETSLPAFTDTVAITLEARGARAPTDDDLALIVRNARLSSEITRVSAGRRTVFLFDVIRDVDVKDNMPIVIGASVPDDVRIAGVVGLGGSARAWGERLNGNPPEDWVPDEPLTSDGRTRVWLGKDS